MARPHPRAGPEVPPPDPAALPVDGLTVAGGDAGPAGSRADLPEPAWDAVRVDDAVPGPDPGTVAAWRFHADHAPQAVALADVPALVADDANFVWVDAGGDVESPMRTLTDLLALPAGAARAVLAPWHRPRLVVYPRYFSASATVAEPGGEAWRLRVSQLDLVVGRNLLISLHPRPLPFAERLRARVLQSPELVVLDAAFMLALVLDELLASYEELDLGLQTATEQLEERALRDDTAAFLVDMLAAKRYAFALAQLAQQHRDVLTAVLRPDFSWVAGTAVEGYFRDLEARLARVGDALAARREGITGAFEIHVAHQGHQTNQVIKLLTMLSAILLPATLIAALFGTSLAGAGGLEVATPAGFAAMLGCIAATAGAILLVFRRRRWL